MILLVSNERDLTTDYVVLELQRRNIAYHRLNSERLPNLSVKYQPTIGAGALVFEVDGVRLPTSDVKAAYFRRPGAPIALPSITNSSDRLYCEQEWASLLRSLYTLIGDRWLNSPIKIALAEDKPYQLAMANSLGFTVPDTLITNDQSMAAEFIQGGISIGKPLHTALLNADDTDPERVIFTSRIGSSNLQAASIAVAPLILQREISKRYDIRVTVVGTQTFAAAIDSQTKQDTSVDWRKGSCVDLPHLRHDLPRDIADMCITLTKKLELRFAAIDLILDHDDRYWFLEANPNGQWAWIENRTGFPIASTIVDLLLDIASFSY